MQIWAAFKIVILIFILSCAFIYIGYQSVYIVIDKRLFSKRLYCGKEPIHDIEITQLYFTSAGQISPSCLYSFDS